MSAEPPTTVTLWWRAATEPKDLAQALEALVDQFEKSGSEVKFSYLEPRPGSGLLGGSCGPPQVLAEGRPPTDGSLPALDEVRLFGADGGLHAIAESGETRWMQWTLRPLGQSAGEWNTEEVEVADPYPLLLLNPADSGRRFGLARGAVVSGPTRFAAQEYRRRGELFCWNLTGADDDRAL